MQTDWILGFIGGLMIGGAAAIFLLINGKIMGASGVFGGLVDGSGLDSWQERASFVIGAILVPFMLTIFWYRPETHITENLYVVVAAGLLVGIGSRMANGCTSGHGVCGISRLSRRSVVATVVYLAAGGITMLLFRHGFGFI